MVPAGPYKLTKQFRREQIRRHKKDMPWSKRVLDLDEHKLFGRTAWAWTRITLFYLTLYLLITLVVMFWYAIFMLAIIKADQPVWYKGQPGVSFVPYNTSTIHFSPNKVHEIYPLLDKIDRYLHTLNENAFEYFHDCNEDQVWGYQKRKPCVFVRLNKVIGYQPETYDTPDELPSDAPSELSDVVRKHGGTPRIWLNCQVTKGPKPSITYYPGPFYETSDKMTGVTRVVAVQLNNMPANQDVFIACKVYARNIEIDMQFQGKGHVKFSMHMRMQTAQKPAEEEVESTSRSADLQQPAPSPSDDYIDQDK